MLCYFQRILKWPHKAGFTVLLFKRCLVLCVYRQRGRDEARDGTRQAARTPAADQGHPRLAQEETTAHPTGGTHRLPVREEPSPATPAHRHALPGRRVPPPGALHRGGPGTDRSSPRLHSHSRGTEPCDDPSAVVGAGAPGTEPDLRPFRDALALQSKTPYYVGLFTGPTDIEQLQPERYAPSSQVLV